MERFYNCSKYRFIRIFKIDRQIRLICIAIFGRLSSWWLNQILRLCLRNAGHSLETIHLIRFSLENIIKIHKKICLNRIMCWRITWVVVHMDSVNIERIHSHYPNVVMFILLVCVRRWSGQQASAKSWNQCADTKNNTWANKNREMYTRSCCLREMLQSDRHIDGGEVSQRERSAQRMLGEMV